MRDGEGLKGRMQQLRRTFEAGTSRLAASSSKAEQDEVHALRARIEHLEQLVQGLQDSVHRESSRLEKRIAELEARIQPAALGKALSDDARARGL